MRGLHIRYFLRRVLIGSLAPRTRQTVRTLVIALVSALALVAIFHLAKLAESQPVTEKVGENGGTAEERRENGERREGGGGEILKSIDGKVLKVKGSTWMEGAEFQAGPINHDNTSPILDLLSRARPHPAIHPILNVPVNRDFLQHEKRVQMDKNLQRQRQRIMERRANASEVKSTLDLVRHRVESERKDLRGKALRLWSPGDTPLRILLVGTWRSGSTFLAQVLASHPAVFQHYEPFSPRGIRQVRSGREAFQAQQLLHRLLDCQFAGQNEYLNYTRHHPEDMVGHNKAVWESCQRGPNVATCFDPTFLSQSCQMFPIQLVKTVRLRLNLTQLFLNDEKMNVKVVFLVRDPRGTMSSRYNSVSWCYDHADCVSSQRLCADMEADLKVATALQHLYPNRFTMIKYEDVAEDPQKQVHSLMSFLGLEYTTTTSQYLQEHTNSDLNTPWSTKRKSQDRVSLWKKQMPLQEVHVIQNSCEGVLKALGYELVGN